MTTPRNLPVLPFERSGPLDIPPQLLALQAEAPIAQVRTPAGDEAWLVTRYEEVRRLYCDERLGNSHRDPEHAPRVSTSAWYAGPSGNFETERADRTRMRSLLLPHFSSQRMARLRSRVAELADQLLDALAVQGPPADLHAAFSVPLSALVVGELLGVPVDERPTFCAWTQEVNDADDPERSLGGVARLFEYACGLATAKRARPGDDVISALCAAENGTLDDGYVAQLAATLLFAGHETTVARTGLAVLLMLTTPGLSDMLASEPGWGPDVVEEVLRFCGGGNSTRYARETFRMGGVTISAGDLVLLSTAAADYDERVFPTPERLDACRKPRGRHLAFGYGPHHCLGAPLARIVLETALTRLASRFPALHLAVPVERLAMNTGLTHGLRELPVAW